MTVPFKKIYNTPADLVSLLQSRGLQVLDAALAERYIENIGYYRLSAYFYPFLNFPKDKHKFKDGSNFADVIELYRFDKKLRLLLFNEIEKIEVSLRSAIANIVASESGNIFWMTDPGMFVNEHRFAKTIELIDKELEHSTEDFIKHFETKYSDTYPPSWMLAEILPLGLLTRVFSNLSDNRLRKKVAARYSLPEPVFSSWITTLTLTRNACCHHARVWNKEFAMTPMVPKKAKRPWVVRPFPLDRIYFNMCIIKWFVNIISPDNDMTQHVKDLLRAFPNVDIKAMGMYEGWDDEPLWK